MDQPTIQRVVKSGQLDYYLPFYIWTDDDADSVCRKIASGLSSAATEYAAKIRNGMEQTIESTNLLSNSRYSHCSFSSKAHLFHNKFKTRKKQIETITRENTIINIEPTESGLCFEFIPKYIAKYNERLEQLKAEESRIARIYGDIYSQSHERIVLPPFDVILRNEESVWVSAILYIFANKMAILKLELPLVNIPFTLLQEENTDHLIKQISPPPGIQFDSKNASLENIGDSYFRTIKSFTKITEYQINKPLTNIILTHYDDQPENLQQLSEDMLIELYRIVAAPVQLSVGNLQQIRDDANRYLESHYSGDNFIRYYFGTAGNCLSVIDTTTLDDIESRARKLDLSIDTREIEYNATSSAYVNLEFSLIVLMLKTLNGTSCFSGKCLGRKEYVRAQQEYNQSRIFIAHIQESCFGSVSEQVALVESMMPYYRKKEIEDEKLLSLDQIILEERAHKIETHQHTISAIGVVLAGAIGLPTIIDSLKILRRFALPFFAQNIPILTIEGVGITLWLALILILLLCTIKKRQ